MRDWRTKVKERLIYKKDGGSEVAWSELRWMAHLSVQEGEV